MDRKNKAPPSGRALKMSGLQTFQLRVLLLCGALTPPVLLTNTDEVICQ